MKKLLLLVVLFYSVCSFGQTPVNRSTSSVTAVDYYVKDKGCLSIPVCIHTPSLNGGLDSLGSICYVKDSSSLFFRDTVLSGGHKWTRIAAGIIIPGITDSVLYAVVDSAGAQQQINLGDTAAAIRGSVFTPNLQQVTTVDSITTHQITTGGYYIKPHNTILAAIENQSSEDADMYVYDSITQSQTTIIPELIDFIYPGGNTVFEPTASPGFFTQQMPAKSGTIADLSDIPSPLSGTGYSKFSGTSVTYISSIPNSDLAHSSITFSNSTGLNWSAGNLGVLGSSITGTIDSSAWAKLFALNDTANILRTLIGSSNLWNTDANGIDQTVHGGNVGIGMVADPIYKLSVSGDAIVNGVTVGLGGGAQSVNTALGSLALLSNTTGLDNVAVGYLALSSDTTGSNNTAVGVNSSGAIITGNNNTSFGQSSNAATTSGSDNIAIGSDALVHNAAGGGNICIGDNSNTNVNNSNNITIGLNTTVPTANYQINIGNAIYSKGDSALSTTKVGIAKTTPLFPLDVAGVANADSLKQTKFTSSLSKFNTVGTIVKADSTVDYASHIALFDTAAAIRASELTPGTDTTVLPAYGLFQSLTGKVKSLRVDTLNSIVSKQRLTADSLALVNGYTSLGLQQVTNVNPNTTDSINIIYTNGDRLASLVRVSAFGNNYGQLNLNNVGSNTSIVINPNNGIIYGQGANTLGISVPTLSGSAGQQYQDRNGVVADTDQIVVTNKISAGTNVTFSGAGTTASPYIINASGGGGGSGINNATLDTVVRLGYKTARAISTGADTATSNVTNYINLLPQASFVGVPTIGNRLYDSSGFNILGSNGIDLNITKVLLTANRRDSVQDKSGKIGMVGDTGGATPYFYPYTTNPKGYLTAATNLWQTDANGIDQLNTGGSVGIGTASVAAYKLKTSGDILVNGIRIGQGAGNTGDNLTFTESGFLNNTSGLFNELFTEQGANSLLTSSGNTGMGYGILGTASGGYNTAIGLSSLSTLTTGNYNVGVGQNSEVAIPSRDNQMSIANAIYVDRIDDTGSERVAIGKSFPDTSAILDLTSTNKGLLIPRINTSQQNTISTPATGLLIFNKDSLLFRYYNGSAWVSLSKGSSGSGVTSVTGNAPLSFTVGATPVGSIDTTGLTNGLLTRARNTIDSATIMSVVNGKQSTGLSWLLGGNTGYNTIGTTGNNSFPIETNNVLRYIIDSTGNNTWTGGTFATTKSAFNYTATFPTTNTNTTNAINATITSAGSSGFTQRGELLTFAAGYTGVGATMAFTSFNTVSGTASNYVASLANYGVQGVGNAVTTGTNVGIQGGVSGGNINIGVQAQSITGKSSATNIGAVALSRNSIAGGISCGLYVGGDSGTIPTIVNAGEIINNQSHSSYPLLLFQRNAVTTSQFDSLGHLEIGGTINTPNISFNVGTLTGGIKASIDTNGNVLKINNVATSFPSSQGAANTVLTNDGSGNLSWKAPSLAGRSDTLLAQAGAVSSISTVAPVSGVYNVGGDINVTALSLDVIQVQVSYIDENGNSQTLNIGNAVSSVGFNSIPVTTIWVRAGTNITTKTTLTTGTGSIAYDIATYIEQKK